MQYMTALEGATSNYPDSPGYHCNAPETSRVPRGYWISSN
jgi:hypothetical protein